MNDIILNTDKSSSISIGLDDSDFADFILNFLGKKENISFRQDFNFVLRLNDLEQFHYLIHQKISREHGTFIDHFSVSFVYNDDTRRSFSGIEQLNNFNETRDVTPKYVTLSWNIIIKFPNSEKIENQKIQLTFMNFIDENKEESGHVILSIDHTNQSWGIEVLNLVKNKISEIANPKSKTKNIAKLLYDNYRLKFLFGFSAFTPLFVLVLASSFIEENSNIKHYLSVLNDLDFISQPDTSRKHVFAIGNLNSSDLEEYAKNIKETTIQDNIKSIAKKKNISRELIFKAISLITFSLIIFHILLKHYLLYTIKHYNFRSFIIINTRSENEYTNYIASKSSAVYYSISGLFLTIILSIISAFVHQLISQ